MEYNFFGVPTIVTDELGFQTITTYDNIGRPQSLLDANGGLTQFFYSVNNQLVGLMDPLGNLTQWIHDAAGNRVQEIDPLGNSKFFDYNAKKELVRITDRNGKVRELAHDPLGRQILEKWIEGETVVRTIYFNYDPNSNLIYASDPDSTYAMTYDELNRMTSIDNLGTPNVPRFILTYSHDAVGNVLSVSDNYGVTVASTWDERDLLATRTWTGPGLDDVSIENFFNELGQEVQSNRYVNGALLIQKIMMPDNMNRVDRLTYLNAVGEVLANFDYSYNLKNLVVRLVASGNGVNGQEISDYLYDPTGQLTDALYNGYQPDEHFIWDLNGNPSGPGYITGPGNRILEDGNFRYEWDNEGNLVRKTDKATGEYWIYTWDHRGRLGAATKYSPGGIVLAESRETYDVLNSHIGRRSNNVQEFSVYDGAHLWADTNDVEETVARYLYGAMVDELIARQIDGTPPLFSLTDGLSSVRDVVQTGVSLDHIVYTAFGAPSSSTDFLVSGRTLYTGREFNPLTGLSDHRRRVTSPSLMRFISEDFRRFESADTNLYRYVHNTPTTFLDPTGEVEVTFYGRTFSIQLHSAHHYWTLFGKKWYCVHIQLLTFLVGVKGSGVKIQIPLPWCAGKPF